MTHKLKDIDVDSILPKKRIIEQSIVGALHNTENIGYNSRCDEEDLIGVELQIEEIAILIMDINFEQYGFSHEDVAYKTAKSIANNPKCFKLVRIK